MKLKIKKELNGLILLGENQQIIAKITRKNALSSTRNIVDAKGNLLYTSKIINLSESKGDIAYPRVYKLYQNDQEVASASITYKEGAKSLSQLPKAEHLDIESPYGVIRVNVLEDHGLVLRVNEQQIGSVSPFYRLGTHTIEIDEIIDLGFIAGLVAFIEYMMHEDDQFVV